MLQFLKNTIIKNALVLISGTVVAQIIPLIMQPLLKRIYSPEDFGVFEVYYRILSILAAVITLKYELGIVQQKNSKQAETLFIISLINGLIIMILLSLSYFIFKEQTLSFFKIPEKFQSVFYILFLSAFLFSLSNAANYLLLRKKQFKVITLSKIIRRFNEALIQTLSFFRHYPILLFIGDLIGNISYICNMLRQYQFKKNELKELFKIKKIVQSYKINFNLAKYNLIPNLLNAFVLSSLTFLTLSNFAINTVGYLELSLKILLIPSSMVSVSVGQGLLQKISANKNKNVSIKNDLLSVLIILTITAIIFSLLIILFAEPAFEILFGKEWLNSAYYAKILVSYISIAFIFSPLGQVLIAFEKFKINAIWQTSRFIVVIMLFLINFTDITDLLIIFSVTNIIFYLIYGIIISYQVNKYEKKIALIKNNDKFL